mmetsp:Transcript_52931/g.105176  ORF Transcript_52931/g.105176 Transcript_52931/m.105176 type:complete len:208 (-) Transcript_52931:388-1011(-)
MTTHTHVGDREQAHSLERCTGQVARLPRIFHLSLYALGGGSGGGSTPRRVLLWPAMLHGCRGGRAVAGVKDKHAADETDEAIEAVLTAKEGRIGYSLVDQAGKAAAGDGLEYVHARGHPRRVDLVDEVISGEEHLDDLRGGLKHVGRHGPKDCHLRGQHGLRRRAPEDRLAEQEFDEGTGKAPDVNRESESAAKDHLWCAIPAALHV